MSLPVISVQQISDTIVSQISASISQAIPLLPKAFTRVLATVFAGVIVLVYKYAGSSFLNLFVAYASFSETTVNGKTIRPLVEWGRLIGVGDPEDATAAQLSINLGVTNQVGSLPGFTSLLCGDTGVLYQTVAAVALNASVVPVTVIAVSDQSGGDGTGSIGNLQPGAVLAFANAPANVASNATVVSQVVTAADAEDVDSYRARIFKRFQRKPQGGAYADYQEWGEGVAGILNVYPYKSIKPGEVDVYVEATVASSGSPDGIPTGPQLTAVLNAINLDDLSGLATRRPVGAAVVTLPITRTAVDVFITGLVADDLAGAKASIAEGLDEYLRSREPFIEGLSVLPRQDRVTVATIGGIVDGLVSAVGGSITEVLLSLTGNQITAYTLSQGEKAKLNGSPTYL